MLTENFPGGSDGKESAVLGSIPGLGRSHGKENGYPIQYFCLENSMDREAWRATYSPWDCKESNMTERLTHTDLYTDSGEVEL